MVDQVAAGSSGADVVEGFRLSPQQRRLWRLRSGGVGDSWVQCTVRFGGRIPMDLLRSSAESVFGRYQALRTRFRLLESMDLPVQVIEEQPTFVLELAEQTAGPASGPWLDSVRMHEQALAGAPDGPAPVRLSLVALPDDRSALVLTASALCADGRSLQILVHELLRTCARGGRSDGPDDPEPLEYVRYAEWRHDVMDSTEAHEGRAYWTALVAGTATVPLPEDRLEASGPRLDRVILEPPGQLVAQLHDQSLRQRVSVQALLLAAWRGLLSRLTGRSDVVVDVLVEGRKFEELQAAVGTFAEYVPLTSAGTDVALVEAARQVDDALALAAELQEYFDRDDLQGDWGGQAPLLGFQMEEWPPAPSVGPVAAAVEAVCANSESFRLRLVWSVLGASVTAQLHFDAARFARSTVEAWLDAYVELLTDALNRASVPIAELRLAGPAQGKALAERSWGRRLDVGDRLLHHRIEDQAARSPSNPAVVLGREAVSFGELNRRANRLARRLCCGGAGPETIVALLLDRSVDQLVAVLATLKAGAAYLPLDVAQPPRRLARLLREVRPAVVVAHADAVARLPVDRAAAVLLLDDHEEPVDEEPGGNLDVEIARDSLAYAIATSGSAGAPKCVMVRHGALANLAAAIERAVYGSFSPHNRVSLNAPLSFDASVKQLVQLGHGRAVCIVSEDERRIGPDLLAGLVRDRVDVLDCTPSHLRMLLDAGLASTAGLPGAVLVGGEAIDPHTWDRLALDGERRYFNVYGPTETTVVATVAEVRAGSGPTIGRPLANVAVHILDRALQPVPQGFVGEICIGGEGVARGYLGRPGATAERFVPDAFSPTRGDRLYRTGDQGRRRADGCIEFLGRSDRQVKVRGFRVELGDVEAALAEHPRVASAVVVASEDEGGDRRLVAYLTEPSAARLPAQGTALHRLPNGLAVAHQNHNETDYLYHEIFEKETYARHGIRLHDGMCVFDVGANIGMFSLFVNRRVTNARIYAFEPIPPVYASLQANAGMHAMQLTAIPIGLAESERVDRFSHYPRYTMMSGLAAYADPQGEVRVIKTYLANEQQQGLAEREILLDRAGELLTDRFQAESYECRLRRLSDVIADLGVTRIDLLKVDVQRAELDVLMGLDEADWPRVRQVVCEVHDNPTTPTEGRLATMRSLLEDHGFDVVVEQDPLLVGTDRHNLYAIRPAGADGGGPPLPATPTVDALSAGELREFLRDRLPDHMIPVSFVKLDELPRTSNGKVDLAALPIEAALPACRRPVAAETPNEADLLEIWSRVLEVRDIGIDDNFFDLGGDSIRSIRVQAAAQKEGLRFSLQDAFQYQTIRALAAHVSIEDSAPAVSAAPFSAVSEADRAKLPGGLVDAYPLASLQAGMVFHSEYRADPATYHNVTALRLRGPFDPVRLEEVLAGVIARHAVLRTSFDHSRFSEPLQLVHERVATPLVVTDVGHLGTAEQDSVIDAAVEAERCRPFDWESAPLLRFEAYDRGDGTFELLCAEYHGILDGWSLHLLLDEVLSRHPAAGDDATAAQAPPARRSYRDFVDLERETARSPHHRDFWVGKLSGRAPAALPAQHRGDSAGWTRHARMTELAIEDDITAALRKVAQGLGMPFKSLLLAAYLRMLHEATGGVDVCTGLVINGREEREDGDCVLGLFLNVVPICWRPVASSGAELADWVFGEEQELLPHRRYPLASMQRDLGGRPLFDNLFNFTQFHPLSRQDTQALEIVGRRGIAVDIDLLLTTDAEVEPLTGALRLTFQYDAMELDDETVAEWAALFRRNIARIADDPHGVSAGTPSRPIAPAAVRALHRTASQSDGLVTSTVVAGDPRLLTAEEADVAEVWAQVLGRVDVGPHDAFHDLGGHSLVAVQIVARLRRRFGVAVRLDDLFEAPTVAGMAARINARFGA